MDRIAAIDSHTAGEPTRTVIAGGPDLGDGPLVDRRARLVRDHAGFYSSVVCEPRGADALVGALLVPPSAPGFATGVIFFNTVGALGMCGHGTIGVIETLRHLGRIGPGRHRLETPVGEVDTELHADGRVTVDSVASYRLRRATVDVPGLGSVSGDIAWGGNWFFLVDWDSGLDASRLESLGVAARQIRRALDAAGVTGAGGAVIDHVSLIGAPISPGAHGRSFVLCPGGAYDRSPCGTGTCARIACLAADGALAAGQRWIQESVLGTTFEASYRRDGDAILPRITGRAYITAELTLVLDPSDPFRHGIPVPR